MWARVKFIIGIVLIGFSQYNLFTLGPASYFSVNRLFSIPLLQEDRFSFGIPYAEDVFANVLLLLIGSLLLISAFKSCEAIPKEKDSTLLSGNFFRFSKDHLFLTRVFGFASSFYLIWQLYHQSKELCLIGLWVVNVLGFGYLVFRLDLQNRVFHGPGIRRSDALWLMGVFLLGLIVGLYRLQGLPNQFVGDEGSFWDMASEIASGTIHQPFFGSGVYSFPNASSIAQAVVLMIFGISLWSWRFSSLLAGLLTIFPLYLLARELFDRQVAVVSCVILITSEYFLAFSRLGYNSSQTLFPVTLALYFIVMGVKRHSLLYFYLGGCAVGLGFYTYTASRSAVLIVGVFMLTPLFQNRNAYKDIFKAIVILILGACIFATPLLVFSGVHDPGTLTSKLDENVFFQTNYAAEIYPQQDVLNDPGTILSSDGVFFFNPRIYAALLTRGLIRTLLNFHAAGLKIRHFISAPLAGFAGAAFFTIRLLISLTKFPERRNYLLLYWFAISILFLSTLNTNPPRPPHTVSVIPLIALWPGLGLVSIANGFSRLFLYNHKFHAILVATLTTGVAISGLYSYFVIMPTIYWPDREQIMSWAGLYAKNEKIIYIYDNPGQSMVVPYVMQFVRPSLSYIAIPPNELAAELNDRTVVFFPPAITVQVESVLKSIWPEIPSRQTFYSHEGAPILEGAANFHTDFRPEPGLAAYLADSYLRPGLWLILLVTVFLVFAMIFRASWLDQAPDWLRRAYFWVTGEPPEALLNDMNELLPAAELAA